MSTCTVLGDAAVHELLMGLSRDEVLTFLEKIGKSLQDYSVTDTRAYQPSPSVVEHADGRRNLFRTFTSSTGVGVKIIVDPSGALKSQEPPKDEKERAERNKLMGLHGVIALVDENGFPNGFINAEEVTGYRTSMSAMLLYSKRKRTANIVIFGAGKQALWHTRLALALRGEDIKKITFVNRTAERTDDLVAQLQKENDERWKAKVEFGRKLSGDADGVKATLEEADVIFCTTPSKQVLFPASNVADRKGGCYISAIGSWIKDMIELDPELLKEVSRRDDGMVVVDDREECMHNTGEGVQSGLKEEQISEVGQVLSELTKPGEGDDRQEKSKKCLEDGFVIYKSVGVSLTDLAAGQAILAMARKKSKGQLVSDF